MRVGDPYHTSTEAVREYYSIVDRCPIDVCDLFTQTAKYWRSGTGLLVGRDSLVRFYTSERMIASGTHTLEALVAEPLRAAACGEFTGWLRDGTNVETGFADFFWFQPDASGRLLISHRKTYFSGPAI